ncbi:uncharacterized protein [Clytia hemisphaerica]|uniref:uncharacterized protein n=1 Tax=Clytia hemisphaerica TaxID=252671 RepID=UPI0034D5C52A
MPMKKAFTLPPQNRFIGSDIQTTANIQHRYSRNQEALALSHHTHPNGEVNTNSRTRYTRPKPSFISNKENITSTISKTKVINHSQSTRHQDREGNYTAPRMNGSTTRDLNNASKPNSPINKNIELEYLSSDIPIEMVRDSDSESVKKMSNPLQQLYVNNAYEEEKRGAHGQPQENKQWYDDGERSKYGNSNMDLVSLHSMISRKSLSGKEHGDEWMVKMSYSLTGALLWIFITLCIEEIDSTTSQKVCHSNQEVRYWASFVCLVVVVTAATIYFQKGNVTQSVVMFLLNSIVLISINHAPLSCIRVSGLDDRDMGRLRGGFLLFLLLAIMITWLLKKYLSKKKPSLW